MPEGTFYAMARSPIEDDVAFGPGDEEGRDVGRADVVEIARDAERFRGPLAPDLVRVQPPGDEDQREDDQQSRPDQHAWPCEVPRSSRSALPDVSFHGSCMIRSGAAQVLSVW